MATMIILDYKGSSKSGNYGHAGRPGKVGGSVPKGGAVTTAVAPTTQEESTGVTKVQTYDQIKSSRHGKGYFIAPDGGLVDITSDFGGGTNDHVGFVVAMEHPEVLGLDKAASNKLKAASTKLYGPSGNDYNERYEAAYDKAYEQLWNGIREAGLVRVRIFGDEVAIDGLRVNDRLPGKLQDLVFNDKLPGTRKTRYSIEDADWTSSTPFISFDYNTLVNARRLRDLTSGLKELSKAMKIRLGYKGSATSGNYAHAGRPGKVGGSAPKGAATSSDGLSAAILSLSSDNIVGAANKPDYIQKSVTRLCESLGLKTQVAVLDNATFDGMIVAQATRMGIHPREVKMAYMKGSDVINIRSSQASALTTTGDARIFRNNLLHEVGHAYARTKGKTVASQTHRSVEQYEADANEAFADQVSARLGLVMNKLTGKGHVPRSLTEVTDYSAYIGGEKSAPAMIILDYKGSATSGNYLHAGRPGKVGGSMPRNYGMAAMMWGGFDPTTQGNFPDPKTLNRAGLQAIIDYSNGNIDLATATKIANDPKSMKPSAAAAATPAPTPPAGTVVLKPPYQPTDAETQSAKDMLATLQDPNNPRGAAHSAWAKDIDPDNLTPQQIKVLNIYASGGMRGTTLKAAMEQHAAKPDAAATQSAQDLLSDPGMVGDWAKNVDVSKLTPAQIKVVNEYKRGLWTEDELRTKLGHPPPPPPKDARFYPGDLTGKSADEIFAGSSKEIQDLALRTGIIATDQASLDYAKAKAGTFDTGSKYIPSYEQMLAQQPDDPSVLARRTITDLEQGYFNVYDTPQHALGSFKTSSLAHANLTPAEQAVCDKLQANWQDAADRYKAQYAASGYSKAWEAQKSTLQVGWANLSPAEKATAESLMQRQAVASWVNGNVHRTLPTTAKDKWEPITIDKVPANITTAAQVKQFGWEYRGTMVRQPKQPATSFKANQTVALSSLPVTDEQRVRSHFDSTWDKVNHGGFGGKVNNVFQIHPQDKVISDFNAVKAVKDNVQELYHGTDTVAARYISSTGYRVKPPSQAKAGRSMGDGIFFADKSSKSSQYLGKTFTRSIGTNGVVLWNQVSLGKVVDQNAGWYDKQGADTIFGGVDRWVNKEWLVFDVKAMLPTLWIDTTLVAPP